MTFQKPILKLILTLVMTSAVLLIGSLASADRASQCARLWDLEKEAGCPVMPPDTSVDADPAAKTCENLFVNSDFGPSKCVIEENLEGEKREIKKQCEDWVKERKAELGGKFLTSTCNPECSPCPKNDVLRHCSYRGEVHYSVR